MRRSQGRHIKDTMYIQEQKKYLVEYSFPQTKLRNIICVHCKRQFWVRDISLTGAHLPLLLECGHATCEGCSKDKEICPICNVKLHTGNSRNLPLPLNVFTLGLAVISHNSSKMVEDPDVTFHPSFRSKLRQMRSQSFCFECGILATLQCEQCNISYCSPCFSKIHKRALQNHKKITLLDADVDNSFVITNTCSKMCNESLEYYCTECEESRCSHCMLRLHRKHEYIFQKDKNEELLPQFHEACDSVAESLQRVLQAQKKVKKMSVLPSKLQNSENVEASINRHFAHLHGVLQNLEKKMIDKLQQQRNYVRENLDDIFRKLTHEEEQLQAALLMAASAKESFTRINLKEVIDKLNKFKNIPCHLVEDMVHENVKLEFEVDKSIIGALEKHCTVKIPPRVEFSLMETKNLPEHYEMEPLTENVHIQNFLEAPLSSSLKSSSSVESYDFPKPNNSFAVEGSTSVVQVCYIDSPECFYVLPLYNVEQYKELCRNLQLHGLLTSKIPMDIAVNKLYVFLRVWDKKWFRGRVQEIHTDSVGHIISCDMFCVDIGCVQTGVSVNHLRDVSPNLAIIPPLVKKCRLHEIVPRHGRWEKEATQHLINMTKKCSEENVSMHVMTEYGGTYSVDLYINLNGDDRFTSIRDSLVYLGYGNFVTQHRLLRLNPQSVYMYYEDELELDKYVDVVCLNVESPDLIYVRKTGENRAYFDKVMNDLNADYTSNLSSKAVIYTPEVGLPCAAQDRSGRWCRGLITGIEKCQKSVEVFFVDTGYKRSIQFDSIRRLPNYYMKCRTQAIRVSTRDVKCPEGNGRWSESTVKMLEIYLMTQPFKVIAIEKRKDTYSVRILFNDNVNLSNLMITSNLAYSKTLVSDIHSQKKKNKSTVWKNRNAIKSSCTATGVDCCSLKNTVSDDCVKEKKPIREHQDPFKICVSVHRVDSPDSIYVSDKAYEDINADLMNELQDFYSKYCSDQCNIWETGAVCVVYTAADKLYYRARITDVKSPEEISVYFYDLGTTGIVAAKDIQPLNPYFAKIPAYIFKVKLAGLLPCGGSTRWPSVSCEKLASIVEENQNCKFYISRMLDAEDEQNVDDKGEVDEKTENKAIAIELWIKQSKTDGPLSPTRIEINSVNRMLLDEGLALPNKKLAEKREKMLAIELQRKLKESHSLTPKWSPTVKWMLIKDELSDSSGTFTENLPQTSVYSSDSEMENDEDETSVARIAAWLPAEPIVENSFIAVGSYLDHSGALYVHHKERSSKTLLNMETELSDYGKKVPLSPYDMEWCEGDVCIAQYHNKKWYRGKVNKIHDNDIEVEFVDYGNIEECTLGTLKKKILFENIPIQCIKCIIHGLEPATDDGKWTIEDLDKIHVLLVDHEFTVQVLNRENTHLVVSIKIHHPKEQDLVNYLYRKLKLNIKMPCPLNITHNSTIKNAFEENLDSSDSCGVIVDEYISIYDEPSVGKNTVLELSATEYIHTVEAKNDDVVSGSPTIAKLSKKLKNVEEMTSQFENLTWADIAPVDENVIVSSTPQNKSCECFQTNYVPLNIPNDVTILEIELCCPVNTTEYYAQLGENKDNPILHAYYKQFQLLMDTLQENACKQPKLKVIECNALCCAQFNDGLWYRCIIPQCKTKSETEVSIVLQFVDYGNEEDEIVDIHNHELYTLNEEWLNLPCMAFKCKLWGVEVHPGIDHKTLLPEITEMHNKLIIAKIKERHDEYFEIELYPDKNCTRLLYSSFIEEGSFIIKKTKED